ncbi:MAG: ketoacyl-ACP synthase III [Syntrophobacterales bacterium]|nr:ketoacyl-ACP synthase III [Syntrophobacterales bacterium]
MLYLHGLGHFHPENVITNRFLEELDIGTSNEWILERVGIRERRTALDLDYIRETRNRDPRAAGEASLCSNARAGAAAARQALTRAGIAAADVGLVISGSSAPDHVTPSEAATVAAELEIEAPCLDINAACATFGVQLSILDRMKPESLPPFVLVVNPESLTRCIDYGDRNTAVLFGDGSAAAVVSAREPAALRLVACDCASKPAAWQKAVIPRTGYFRQEGNAVQGFAIRKMTEAVRSFQNGGPEGGRRPIFIGHQANLGILETVRERASIPGDRHWHNVTMFGNTGCSGAPAVLSQHRRELQPGDWVIMALVGAGLTWATLVWHVAGQGEDKEETG